MQYIINLGKQLVNSLKYIEKRTNMKVKTSFLNLFVFDDIYTLDSIPEVLIFLAGAPKGLYDAKTDDKEKEIKKLEDQGKAPIIITSPIVRMYFKKLTKDYFKDLIVVSYNEIESDVELQSIGVVTYNDN